MRILGGKCANQNNLFFKDTEQIFPLFSAENTEKIQRGPIVYPEERMCRQYRYAICFSSVREQDFGKTFWNYIKILIHTLKWENIRKRESHLLLPVIIVTIIIVIVITDMIIIIIVCSLSSFSHHHHRTFEGLKIPFPHHNWKLTAYMLCIFYVYAIC